MEVETDKSWNDSIEVVKAACEDEFPLSPVECSGSLFEILAEEIEM